MRAEPKGQHGGLLKARSDNAGMITLGLLIDSFLVFGLVLRDNHRQVTCREDKGLIAKET